MACVKQPHMKMSGCVGLALQARVVIVVFCICLACNVCKSLAAGNQQTVGVAAIQLYSRMGRTAENSKRFPQKAVIPYGFDVIVANWASLRENQRWPGRGHSCIISGDGKVLDMAESLHGEEIVLAELQVPGQNTPGIKSASEGAEE